MLENDMFSLNYHGNENPKSYIAVLFHKIYPVYKQIKVSITNTPPTASYFKNAVAFSFLLNWS